MNERIKQLALECGAWHQVYEPQLFIHDKNFDVTKFAELIVQECCLKLLNMDEKTKGNHNYYKHAALEVKKHFGVEE